MTKAVRIQTDLAYGDNDDTHEINPADVRDTFETLTDGLNVYRHLVVMSATAPGTVIGVAGFVTITKIIVRAMESEALNFKLFDGTNWAELKVNALDKIELCYHEVAAGDFKLETSGSTTPSQAEIWIFGT